MPGTQQSKPKYLELKPEDAEKIRRSRERSEKLLKVDDEMILVAEFGMYYGYAAVQAVLNDEIDIHQMLWLVEAARKVDARDQYNLAVAVFTAVGSTNSKDPSKTFASSTKALLKRMRADS